MARYYKRHQREGICHYFEVRPSGETICINFLNAAPIIEARPFDPDLPGICEAITQAEFTAALGLAIKNPETKLK